MKKIFQSTALLMFCLLGACSEDGLDDLSGKYDLIRGVYTKVTEQSTVKLGKGIKRLDISFENEAGGKWDLHINSRDWVLQEGVYQVNAGNTDQNAEPGTLSGSVENNPFASGNLEVTLLNDVYYLDGMFEGTDGNQYSCDYKGPITFEIGEDDPEASGYTAVLTTSPVYLTDESGQVSGVVPGVTQYSFAISDPEGNGVAQFDLINNENLGLEALAGGYSVTGTNDPGSLVQGNALPADWGGWSWGSYFVADGAKQYILEGRLEISIVTGMEGEKLLTFTGKGMNTTLGMDATGAQVPGTASDVDYRFVTVLQSTGIELRDQQMQSTVLGRPMPFSVYLPKSYNGQKEYPVLYLLHGAGGNHNDWMIQGMLNPYASAAESAGGKEMIIVCPNGTET